LFFSIDSGSNISALGSSTHTFVTDQPTLALGNVSKREQPVGGRATYHNSSFIVQITPNKVLLLELSAMNEYAQVAQWTPEPGGRIIAASINATQVALGLSGKKILVLRPPGPGETEFVQTLSVFYFLPFLKFYS
jgi:hypothetical protein